MDAVPGGKIKASIGPIPGCGVGPDSLILCLKGGSHQLSRG